jgi:DNA recombination protein Rad52
MVSTEITVLNGDQGFTQEQQTALNAAMDASIIKHRTGGGGQQLAYIKGKAAIDAANRVFGHGRWGYKILSRTLERTTDEEGRTTSEYYAADIELYVVGNPFPFPGDGIGIVIPPKRGSIAEAHEKARKESVTDALKRALRHYGSQFANDLYDEDALVDAGEGVLVPVKEVKPGKTHQNGKRVVDEKPPMDDKLKARLNSLFERAKPLGVLPEPSAKGFLQFASTITGTAITHPSQLDQGKLSQIEDAIVAKEADKLETLAAKLEQAS